MAGLRAFFRFHRAFALALVCLALAMKALVPAGYMPGQGSRLLTVSICADASGEALTRQIAVPARPGETQNHAGEHKSGGTCAFSSLAMAGLAGADALLLAGAFAFILALGFTATPTPAPRRTTHLRPPLRGPPLLSR